MLRFGFAGLGAIATIQAGNSRKPLHVSDAQAYRQGAGTVSLYRIGL